MLLIDKMANITYTRAMVIAESKLSREYLRRSYKNRSRYFDYYRFALINNTLQKMANQSIVYADEIPLR